MVQVAERTLKDVDVILWLVEPTTFIGAGERHIAEQLGSLHLPVLLIINKVDTVDREEIAKAIDTYRKLYHFDEIIPVSALRGVNTEDIIPKYSQVSALRPHVLRRGYGDRPASETDRCGDHP